MTKYTLYILLTVLLTVYGQIIVKWKMLQVEKIPEEFFEKMFFIISYMANPWIVSAFLGAFIGAVLWMYAMTKVDLSYAYPFISLSFVMVLIFSHLFFKETISAYKLVGMMLIITGVIVSARA